MIIVQLYSSWSSAMNIHKQYGVYFGMKQRFQDNPIPQPILKNHWKRRDSNSERQLLSQTTYQCATVTRLKKLEFDIGSDPTTQMNGQSIKNQRIKTLEFFSLVKKNMV